MRISDLQEALQNPNVRAFLRVIREGESGQSDAAYRMENGGKVFDQYQVEHPYKGQKAPPGKAFGAYQFIPSTWAGLVKQYGFQDMSPEAQDMAAVALIAGRGALDEIKAGKLEEAFFLLEDEWTSLPGGAEPNAATARAREVFSEWGGEENAQVKEVKEEPVGPLTPLVVPAITEFAIPALTALLPFLKGIFTKGHEGSASRLQAAQIVMDQAVKATKTPNIQAAIETMQASPEARIAVEKAIKSPEVWGQLVEVGGGIKAAREYNSQQSGDWRKLIFSLPFVGLLLFIPTIWAVVGAAVFKAPWIVEMDNQLRAAVIAFVMGTLGGSIAGYIYGSSMTKSPQQPVKE